jgi:hypothetical protein
MASPSAAKTATPFLVIVQPQTVIRWHRDAIGNGIGHGRAGATHAAGRGIAPEVRDLIIRMARKNALWGAHYVLQLLR